MKKRRWLIPLIALGALVLLASRVLCPHPEHWLEEILYATGLERAETVPDFDASLLQPQEPADYAADQPAVCEVHRTEMRAEVVPVRYGLPGWAVITKDGQTLALQSDAPRVIRKQQFPYAEYFADGGCSVTNLSPKTARVRICSDCERVEQQWRAQHPAGQ